MPPPDPDPTPEDPGAGTETGPGRVVRNRRNRPVEVIVGHQVVRIPPLATATVPRAGDRDSAQLHELIRRGVLSLDDPQPEPQAGTEDEADPEAGPQTSARRRAAKTAKAARAARSAKAAKSSRSGPPKKSGQGPEPDGEASGPGQQ